MSELSTLQYLLKGLSCIAKHPPRQLLYAEHLLAILAARKLWQLLRRRSLQGTLKLAAGSFLSAVKTLPGASGVVEKEKQETLAKIEEFVLGKDDEELSHILTKLPSNGYTFVAGETEAGLPQEAPIPPDAPIRSNPARPAQQGPGQGALRLPQGEGGRVPVGQGVRGHLPQAGCGHTSLAASPCVTPRSRRLSLPQGTTSTTSSATRTCSSATRTRSTPASSPACASSRRRS